MYDARFLSHFWGNSSHCAIVVSCYKNEVILMALVSCMFLVAMFSSQIREATGVPTHARQFTALKKVPGGMAIDDIILSSTVNVTTRSSKLHVV